MNGHRFSFGQYKGDLIIDHFPDNYTVNMVFTHCDCLKEDILPIIDHNAVKIIRLSSIKKYLVDRVDNIIFCNSKEY